MSRCYICDRILSPEEIQFNRDHDDFDPCGTCLEVINDLFNHDDEEEIDAQLAVELYYEGLIENQNVSEDLEDES